MDDIIERILNLDDDQLARLISLLQYPADGTDDPAVPDPSQGRGL